MKYNGDTPDLARVIRAGIADTMFSFFTCIVGTIKSYDGNKQCASVEPAVKAFDGAQNALDLPVLVCMPVAFPSGGGYSFKWNLEPGDPCIVIFSSVSIAQWLEGGDRESRPESPRRNSLSDGIVIPGVRPFSDPLEPLASGVDLAIGKDDGSATVSIESSGLIKAQGSALQVNGGAHTLVAGDLMESELYRISTALGVLATALAIPNPYTPGSSPIVPPAPPPVGFLDVDSLTSD